MTLSTQISITLAPLQSLEGLEREWRALEERADIDFYLSWGWIGTLVAQVEHKPLVLRATDKDKTVALGLIFKNRETRHRWLKLRKIYLNETGHFDIDILFIEHNGFLCDRAYGPQLAAHCIDYVLHSQDVRALLGDWDEWRFGGIGEEYLNLLKATGLRIRLHSEKRSGVIDLDSLRASQTDYLSTLSSNTRYQIRRALKLYGERGTVAITAARTEDDFARYLNGMIGLHQSYWVRRGEKGAFGYPFLHAFHHDILMREGPKGHVELLRISAGESDIGYLYNFTWKGKVGAYLSGFAYEDDAKLKPGLVSHYLAIERHLKGNAHSYDLLAGDMQYKRSLSGHYPPMYWADLQRARTQLRLEDLARWMKNRLSRGLPRKVGADPQPPSAAPADRTNA